MWLLRKINTTPSGFSFLPCLNITPADSHYIYVKFSSLGKFSLTVPAFETSLQEISLINLFSNLLALQDYTKDFFPPVCCNIAARGFSEHLRNDLTGENTKYLEHIYLGNEFQSLFHPFEKIFVKLINEFLLLLKSNQFQKFPLAGELLYSKPASRQLNLSLYGRHSPTLLLSSNLTYNIY